MTSDPDGIYTGSIWCWTSESDEPSAYLTGWLTRWLWENTKKGDER